MCIGAHTYVAGGGTRSQTPGSCPAPRGTSAAAAATAGTPPGAEDARPGSYRPPSITWANTLAPARTLRPMRTAQAAC